MDEELKKMFQKLEEQGWEPMLCDTPVPYYDNRVMCGSPNGLGDFVAEEMLLPKRWTSIDNIFITAVRGDSMIDANIVEGDRIIVENTTSYDDGDIVLLEIDGEYTLKSYCRDDDGRPWLIPQNSKYKAFTLDETQDVRVCGVVREVIKEHPRIAFRTCMKKINETKRETIQVNKISPEQVSKAIQQIAPMVKMGRQWYAVYRAMVDAGVQKLNDFDGFCSKIKNDVPEHDKLPKSDELQRLAVDSFRNTVSTWRDGYAPVSGKRFNEYLEIAQQMKSFLNNC